MSRRRHQEVLLVLQAPDEVDSAAVIEAATAFAGINRNLAAILCDREDAREHRPGIVGLPQRLQREFVSPFHKLAARLTRGQSLDREVAERLLYYRNLFDV